MQFSHYLKVYPCEERAGYLLLFSTKQGSTVLLKKEKFRSIENASLSPSDAALLSRLGMIVEDREAEKRTVFGFLDRFNACNSVLNLTIVVNLDCNFACTYCYEGDMKGNLYMSDTTAAGLIDFIKKKFTENKTSLLVDFYGGEPLLSTGRIVSISRAIQSFIESKGASYRFSLITNGSLLTRRVAEKLAPIGLENVKITIDGPAEIHDRNRPFKSGAGSFHTIIHNIQETCDLVSISIGGNYESHNYEKFPLLLDYLMSSGLTPDRLRGVKFDPVMKGPDQRPLYDHFKGGCTSIYEPWIVRAEALLREEILKKGYNTPKPRPMTCMIESKDAYVVNFDGVLYKCPAFIGQKGFSIGDLQTGVRDYTDLYKIGIWKNAKCAECEYLPMCFGGCRYMVYVREGNVETLDCRKDHLDASLEALIKQDIKYRAKVENR